MATQDVLFYALPEHAHFYAELLNLLAPGAAAADGGSGHGTATVLFNRWDAPQLDRVVGAARARKMLTGSAPTYMFC
jgi:U3 small nucleolar RNA-associated protein 25